MTVQEQHIPAGNWEQLQKVLCSSGVSQSDLESLSSAVSEDKKTMGTAVKGGSRDCSKGAERRREMAAAVGKSILTEYLRHYFGLN